MPCLPHPILIGIFGLPGWSLAWAKNLHPYHTAPGFLSDDFTLHFVQHRRTRRGQSIEPSFMPLPKRWHRMQHPLSLVLPTLISMWKPKPVCPRPLSSSGSPTVVDSDSRSLLMLPMSLDWFVNQKERIAGAPNDTLLCPIMYYLRNKAMIRVFEGSNRRRLGPK